MRQRCWLIAQQRCLLQLCKHTPLRSQAAQLPVLSADPCPIHAKLWVSTREGKGRGCYAVIPYSTRITHPRVNHRGPKLGPCSHLITRKGSKTSQTFQIAPIMHINRLKCAGRQLVLIKSKPRKRESIYPAHHPRRLELSLLWMQTSFTWSKVEALSVSDPDSRFPGPPQKSLAQERAGSLPPTLCNLRHAARAAF